MTYESEIQTEVLEGARGMGCLAEKISFAGRRGGHDTIIIVPKHLTRSYHVETLWLELKKPGGRTSVQQDYFHELMGLAGANQYVTDDVDDALRWIQSFKRPGTTADNWWKSKAEKLG